MRTITYNNIVLYVIGALAGSLMVIGVAVFFEKYFREHIFYKAILYEGKNTVIILSLNRVVQCLIAEKIYYTVIFPFVDGMLIEKYVFVLFVVMSELLIFLPVIYCVDKFIPSSVGRRRKNFV